MSYDFPASPSENDEFVPPVGGQTYIYKAPRWLVKGVPPIAGGGGGGIGEAPVDGNQYAREDAAWSVIEPGVSDWADIENKPATFPPTVPIPWTDVSGKPATFPPTVPIPWTDVSGKPATYPPTLPIAQADVTNLTTDLAGKVNDTGDTMTGALVVPAGTAALPGVATGATNTGVSGSATTFNISIGGSARFLMDTSKFTPTLPLRAFDGTAAAPSYSFNSGTTSGMWRVGTDQIGFSTASTNRLTLSTTALTSTLPITTPTPATADNNTTVATTAFVKAQGYAPLASPVFTGTPTAPTPAAGDSSANLATTSFVKVQGYTTPATVTSMLSTYAPLFSPELTGDPKAPTPATSDNDTSIATTAFVKANLATIVGGATISDTPPSSPTVGQLWFESDSGRTFVWYTDANSSQWVQIAPGGSGVTAEARNRVINPAMQVSQENGRSGLAPSGTQNYHPADQWWVVGSVPSAAFSVHTFDIAYSNPPTGVTYAINIATTTTKAVLASSDYLAASQNIEGINVSDFMWGTAQARQAVLRFSIYASRPGTYSVFIMNDAQNRTFLAPFTITAGGTWQTVSIVIPGDTTGTWIKNNNRGMWFGICTVAGSGFVGTAGWQAGAKYGVPGMTNGADTGGNWYITAVGLYLDPQATGLPPAWVMPDEAEELRACLRYWQAYSSLVVDSSTASQSTVFRATMRAVPAVSGGGAGFVTTSLTAYSVHMYQTTRNYNTIVLNARM